MCTMRCDYRAFSGLHLFYIMIIINITQIFKRLNKGGGGGGGGGGGKTIELRRRRENYRIEEGEKIPFLSVLFCTDDTLCMLNIS